jgi:ABC-type Zn uptake system ZnuABC Zn-binding protein ZnuA
VINRRSCITRSLTLICAMALFIATTPGCTSDGSLSQNIMIVTSSNIIADWVTQVGGGRLQVYSLLTAGADPHTFQPSAGDVARVASARVIFTVGLGLEGAWLNRLLENAAANPDRVKTLGDHIDALPAPAEPQHAGNEAPGQYDPHFWWDPIRVKLAVEEIVRQLAEIDPDGSSLYSQAGSVYLAELDRLDSKIRQRVEQIPLERRKIVTSHETMQYFATRYRFEAVGSVFSGVTTEKEPSPAELADLVMKIKALGVPVIFTETTVSDRLARAVADETGAEIVRIYSDSLGPSGSSAETYFKMMDNNTTTIVTALSSD